MIHSFGGHLFKDINAWIDDNRILCTISTGTVLRPYTSHIGIAYLKKATLHEIALPR